MDGEVADDDEIIEDDDDLDRMSFRLEVCSWHTYGSPFAARPILALAATR